MSIKGFRVRNTMSNEICKNLPGGFNFLTWDGRLCFAAFDQEELSHKLNQCADAFIIEFDTGSKDGKGSSIYEGDWLRSKTCETPFQVEDIVSFLIMCGRYEEKHGTPIFDSLEIVENV